MTMEELKMKFKGKINNHLRKKLTISKFNEYEKKICKAMGFSKSVWRQYRKDIIEHFGYYDPNVTYAGRGDSREFSISEKIVPELYDNFIYYVHDAFYKLTKVLRSIYVFFKEKADIIMKKMMEIKVGRFSVMPSIFHFFVKYFG